MAAASAWFVVHVLFGFGLVFPFADIPTLGWTQLWIPALLGVGTGLFSALYNASLLAVTRLHDRQTLIPAPLKPLLPFLLSGVLLYVYPQVLVGVGYSLSLIHIYLGRAAGDEGAVLKDEELLADLHDKAHVVLDEQHRDAPLPDGVDKLDEHRRLGIVHAPGRLVQNDQLGIGSQRPGDFKQPLVAVGQAPRCV